MTSREGEAPQPRTSGDAIREMMESLRRRVSRGDFAGLPIVVALIVIVVYFQSQNDNFLSPRNLSNLALQISVTGTLAIGVVLVLLAGEIDLSIGSVMGLSAGVLVVLITAQDVPWWLGIAAMAAVALAIGAAQGLWVTRSGVPSFVVTLAGLLIWFGVQLIVLGGQTGVNVRDPYILSLANSYLSVGEGWLLVVVASLAFSSIVIWDHRRRVRQGGVAVKSLTELVLEIVAFVLGVSFVVFVLNLWRGVPTAALALIGLILIFDVLTRRTQFGRHIYAIGGNRESSRRAGIDVPKTVVAVMMLSSLMAAAAALMATSRLSSAGTLTGGGTQMIEAIGAAVIGGTSLYGGRGTVWAALFGALVMGSVSNGLDLMGQRAEVKFVTQGAILLAAVTIDTYSRRRLAAAGL